MYDQVESKEFLVNKKWRLLKKIGSGSFGNIYLGINLISGEEVAVKLESVVVKHPQLSYESKIYRMLQVFHIIRQTVISFAIRMVWEYHDSDGLD